MYDCAIVGGGIAGMQAAIQLGRYKHSVIVIDAGEGRSSLCRRYHNLLGYPDGISGSDLLAAGRTQAEQLGVTFLHGIASDASQAADAFTLEVALSRLNEGDGGQDYVRIQARRLLLATGVKDRLPEWPALFPCLGISVFVCPDCDGYEAADRHTLVLGSGNAGAGMALTLTHWTRQITYVNHELETIDDEMLRHLDVQGIPVIDQPVSELLTEGDQLRGVLLADGRTVEADRGFTAFGGNEVRSSLGAQLGVKLAGNRHIETDSRTKQTSVPYVWAAGDVAVHSEQAAIAMGDGSQAAIWMHKSLLDK
jgi:thioredoxin reductase (NADPH)